MTKKLVLLSALFLWPLAIAMAPLLSLEQSARSATQEGFLFGAASAYASESRIVVEGADTVFSQELTKPEQLSDQVADLSPRILVEYADSILSLDLERPLGIVPTPTPTPTPTQAPGPGPTVTATPTPTPTPTPTLMPTSEDDGQAFPLYIIWAALGGLVVMGASSGYLWRRRRRALVMNRYKEKLDQWDEEGYDVSDFKKRWFG